MDSQIMEQAQKLVSDIRNHGVTIDTEAKRLRTKEILDAFDPTNHNAWCLAVVGDALVRLRLFSEQNFHYIETMGTIAVARYTFELSVWLKLFESDPRYGLVYYAEFLQTQRRFWEDSRAQCRREIDFLRTFGQKEKEAMNEEMARITQMTDSDEQQRAAQSMYRNITTDIDSQAARKFSVFADQAKTNGYSFQAHLIEKQSISEIDNALLAIETQQSSFNSSTAQGVKDLVPKQWRWRQMAQKVDLTDEYDYIYTYTSKFLHATPASITTDQKNPEMPELVLFLKYINVKFADIIELSEGYPRVSH